MEEKDAFGALRAMLSFGSPELSKGGGSIPCFGRLVNCLEVLREDFLACCLLLLGRDVPVC